MVKHSIQLEVMKAKVIGLSREGDQHVMDDTRALHILDDKDLTCVVYTSSRSQHYPISQMQQDEESPKEYSMDKCPLIDS